MELFNSIIQYDKQFLIWLHSQGNVYWDEFWLFVTNPFHWLPLFLVLFFLGNRAYNFKKASVITFFIILSGISSFAIVNLIKNTIQRLRPINDSSINKSIRILIEANDFSFVSGHSTVSFTIAFLSFWVLRKKFRYAYIVFLFPILFAYSRLYLAAHFPLDILFGIFLGNVIALIYYKIINYSLKYSFT